MAAEGGAPGGGAGVAVGSHASGGIAQLGLAEGGGLTARTTAGHRDAATALSPTGGRTERAGETGGSAGGVAVATKATTKAEQLIAASTVLAAALK